jgi:hypothetical protein
VPNARRAMLEMEGESMEETWVFPKNFRKLEVIFFLSSKNN